MEHLLSLAPSFTQSLGWTLLHSLWQAALIYGLLRLIFYSAPFLKASQRYNISLLSMLLLCTWVIITGIDQWQSSQASVTVVAEGAQVALVAPSAAQTTLSLPLSTRLLSLFVLAYVLGVLLFSIRVCRAFFKAHSLKTNKVFSPNPQLVALLSALKADLGIARDVTLRISERVAVPMVIGALRPMILLPASMLECLGTEGIKAILLHELAHISREDYLINLLQSIAETLLFFNPFVWLISGHIRREREHCCDDMVVNQTSQPLVYAQSLALLAGARVPAVAVAANGANKNQLFNRIKRIVEMKKTPARYTQLMAASVLAAVMIAGSVIWLTPSFAQRKKQDSRNQSPTAGSASGKEKQSNVDQQPPAADAYQKPAPPVVPTPPDPGASIPTPPPPAEPEVAELEAPPAPAEPGDVVMDPEAVEAMAKMAREVAKASLPIAKAATKMALKASEQAIAELEKVDWEKIGREIERAGRQMKETDWEKINKTMASSMAAARKSLADAANSKEARQAMAMASDKMKEAARTQREAMASRRQEMARAKQELEQARAEMANARKELEEMRRQLAESRRELQEKQR